MKLNTSLNNAITSFFSVKRLKISSGSILFLILTLITLSCSDKSVNSPKNWLLGTYGGVLSEYTLENFVKLKENGINVLEIGVGPLVNITQQEREEWCNHIKELADAAGLNIWSVHLPFSRILDISASEDSVRQNMIELCTDLIELCSVFGTQKYIIHPSAEPIDDSERNQRIENSIASLKILNEVAQAHNAKLAVECLPRTCLGNTSEELLMIVKSVGNGIEVCFDSNHLLKENPEDFVKNVGSLITTIHISDYDGLDEKHWLPGKGVINWKNVIQELVNAGYSGPFMFEVVPRNNPGMEISSLKTVWDQLLEDYYASKS